MLRGHVITRLTALVFLGFMATAAPGQDTLRAKRDTVQASQDTSLVPPSGEQDSSLPREVEFRKLTTKAFGTGERLVFDVGFGIITAGAAVMEIPDYQYYHGRKCYRIQFRVSSLPFFSTFYKVEDRYLSLMDVEGLFPWRFEQRIREGGYERDFSAEFDHANLVARTSEGDYPIPQYVHDVVSAFYFTRTLDFTGFRSGQRVNLQNFYKDSTYQLDVRFRGRQTVEVPAGTFNCIVVEPLVKEGGLFKSEGSILVWLTDDERKLPIKVMSKIIIGSITAELREYSGINGPISAKVNK